MWIGVDRFGVTIKNFDDSFYKVSCFCFWFFHGVSLTGFFWDSHRCIFHETDCLASFHSMFDDMDWIFGFTTGFIIGFYNTTFFTVVFHSKHFFSFVLSTCEYWSRMACLGFCLLSKLISLLKKKLYFVPFCSSTWNTY